MLIVQNSEVMIQETHAISNVRLNQGLTMQHHVDLSARKKQMIHNLKPKVSIIHIWRNAHNLAKIMIKHVQGPMLTVLITVAMILVIDAIKHANKNKMKVNFKNVDTNVIQKLKA